MFCFQRFTFLGELFDSSAERFICGNTAAWIHFEYLLFVEVETVNLVTMSILILFLLASADLTAAYEPGGAESVVRGLKMIKDKECVVIQDEISLHAPGEIYWFAHTKGQITLADDGRSAVVTVGSERLWVGILSDEGRLTVMNDELLPTSRAVANQKDNSECRKLAIHLTDTKDTTISVACIPLKQGETQPAWTPAVKAISEWTTQTEMGDVNADSAFNIADAVLLQKWLLAVPDTHLKNWKAADFNGDKRLDARDLSMMKRALLANMNP